MQTIAKNSANVAGYADMTSKATLNNAAAARWGSNIDMAELPDWSHEFVAENVLYTRNFLAANPETMKEDGSIDLGTAGEIPLAIPQDVAAALNNAGANAPSSSAAAPSGAATSATPEPSTSGTSENQAGSASSLATSPKVMLAVAAVVATFLL
jgi:hypothetical protein